MSLTKEKQTGSYNATSSLFQARWKLFSIIPDGLRCLRIAEIRSSTSQSIRYFSLRQHRVPPFHSIDLPHRIRQNARSFPLPKAHAAVPSRTVEGQPRKKFGKRGGGGSMPGACHLAVDDRICVWGLAHLGLFSLHCHDPSLHTTYSFRMWEWLSYHQRLLKPQLGWRMEERIFR